MRMQMPRDFYIPKGAMKVSDKLSDAVVYLYASAKGEPCAAGFHGKADKPDFRFRYRTEAERERSVMQYFQRRRTVLELKAERRQRLRAPNKLQEGHILYTSWGYDQTNIDWYEVTRIVSPTMVEVRKIAAVRDVTGHDQGRCYPKAGEYTGPATRHRVKYGDSIKVGHQTAWLWDGRPKAWSSYH